MQPHIAKIMLAEAIGAFTLTFIGVLAITSAALVGAPPGMTTLASIAFAQGLAIGVMVAALGHVSGGHFNPAITFGFVVSGRMSPLRGLLYWIAQLAGAIIAAAILLAIIGRTALAAGTPALAPGIGVVAGAVLEGIGTFFLVYVVFGTVIDRRAPPTVYPLAIGLTIVLCIMGFGLLTGSAINPSRSFGPALVSGQWANEWVYWVGPLIGGGLAGSLYQWVMRERGAGVITLHGRKPTEEEERRRAA
jgi:MIP family channel proteins